MSGCLRQVLLCLIYLSQLLIAGSSEEPLSQGSSSLSRAVRKTTPTPVPTPDPELDIGSMVEVMSTTKPMYGLIKWIGHLPDQKDPTKLIAGLEMVRNLEDHTTRAKVIKHFYSQIN